MKKYLIVAFVILSSCQKEASTDLLPINIKGKILFISEKIYEVNADGTNRQVIADIGVGCNNPLVLSHDGKKIVYASFDTSNSDYYILTTDIDGQNKTVLYKGKQFCRLPAWSPDDNKVCFVKSPIYPDTNYDIYIVNSDGSNETRLTNQHVNFSPQFLPDNSGIVYSTSTCSQDCSKTGIYRMNTDGSNKRLLSPPGKPFHFPKISPNGKMIAMNSVDWNGTQIFTMNTDGTNLKQMTFTVDQHYYDTGFPKDGNDNPVWSSGSDKLAYISYEHGNPDIFTINANGSGNRRLTNNPLRDETPSWSPDGNYIVYSARRKMPVGIHNYTVNNIFIMRSDGRSQTPLTNTVGEEYFPIFISK